MPDTYIVEYTYFDANPFSFISDVESIYMKNIYWLLLVLELDQVGQAELSHRWHPLKCLK